MRARAVIEEKEARTSRRSSVTEIPYQVNSAKLIENIAELVRDKKLEGITDIRNESDRDGLRIVIELRRDAIRGSCSTSSTSRLPCSPRSASFMARARCPIRSRGGSCPRSCRSRKCSSTTSRTGTKSSCGARSSSSTRRSRREHILEGLKIAVDNIDEVIKIIRAAPDTPTANGQLQARFKLSDRQTEAILNMRLAKLTGLEIEKLEEELKECRRSLPTCVGLLASKERRMALLKSELVAIGAKYRAMTAAARSRATKANSPSRT